MVDFEEITRDEWGAQESKSKMDLWNPVGKILFVYKTQTDPCFTKDECIKAVRNMQIRHMYNRRMPDINYNFLIGGDGNIYEGIGFTKKVVMQADYTTNALIIGLIGDYAVEDPPQIMLDVADEFVRRYIVEGKIAPNWQKGYIR